MHNQFTAKGIILNNQRYLLKHKYGYLKANVPITHANNQTFFCNSIFEAKYYKSKRGAIYAINRYAEGKMFNELVSSYSTIDSSRDDYLELNVIAQPDRSKDDFKVVLVEAKEL